MGDVRRVQALLRSALAVVDETPDTLAAPHDSAGGEERPSWPAAPGGARETPVALPPAVEEPEEIRKLAG